MQSSNSSQSGGYVLATLNPNATATTTPFLPQDIAVAVETTIEPGFPTATLEPEIEPTSTIWYENVEKPEGQFNLMVFGNDWRPGAGYRTDVMILFSINTKTGKLNVISFPRDLYIDIPGIGMNRMNTAMPFGGFSLFADTLDYNFHVRPDAYIMTNFQGFVSIVNTLGGIQVNAAQYLSDTCDLPQASNGYCAVGPGLITMDGNLALWYVRSRYTTSDFDRNRRQQEVLYAFFNKLMSMDAVTRAPELYDLFKYSVETDLGLEDFIPLAGIANSLTNPDNITQYYIGSEQTTPYITNGGGYVMLPNQPLIDEIIMEAIYNQ